jgi:hypothetical protein
MNLPSAMDRLREVVRRQHKALATELLRRPPRQAAGVLAPAPTIAETHLHENAGISPNCMTTLASYPKFSKRRLRTCTPGQPKVQNQCAATFPHHRHCKPARSIKHLPARAANSFAVLQKIRTPASRLLYNSEKRRVGAPGLQNFHANRGICRLGAPTGRFLPQPASTA